MKNSRSSKPLDKSSPRKPYSKAGNVQLDRDQQAFCDFEKGNVRLLAPAGCGKTHSLLWRCLRLVERSTKEKPRFLLFSFTRAARDELRDRLRIQKQFESIASLVTVMTLNAWGLRYIRSRTHNLRTITKKKDLYFVIHNVLQPIWKEHGRVRNILTDTRRKYRAGETILRLIDNLKSLGFRHDKITGLADLRAHMQYLQKCGMQAHILAIKKELAEMDIIPGFGDEDNELMQHFIGFWREAVDALYRSAFITLDDQKYWALLELEMQHKGERTLSGAARYHHILVDEFQDINPLDLSLLRAIARINDTDLTIVGDDDQAIYEWRGATPTFILEPQNHIQKEYETITLGTNYRSPRNIVELSQRLIAYNKRRVTKNVLPYSDKEAVIEVKRFTTLSDSIDFVLQLVKKLLKERGCKNIALIGRKRSQIIPYQIVFADQNIPFYAAEDLQILLSTAFNELKQMLIIRARADKNLFYGSDPVTDLLNLCDKVKRFPLAKKDREGLHRYLYQSNPKNMQEAISALRKYTGTLKRDSSGRMAESFAGAALNLVEAPTVAQTILAISQHLEGLQKDYGKALEDIFYTDPPFLYLSEYALRYGADFQAFYQDVEKAIATLARIPPEDDDDKTEANWKLPLHLMTALRAKGKEFDTVIVLDANDDIWPSKLATTPEEYEQERRLFYVAASRARKHLYFLVDDSILGESVYPTPYLYEMGLKVPGGTRRPKKEDLQNLSLFDSIEEPM